MANQSTPNLLELVGIGKKYENNQSLVIEDLDLTIAQGEIFCLLGASGCGKSTLLKIIAGLAGKHSGRVFLSNIDITAEPAYKRDVNMMFQSYFLFPHLNVFQNIAFGLKRAGIYSKSEITERVTDLIELMKLVGKESSKSHQLSGGEQQRVALARAVARNPQLILLDEPLAALDKKLRETTILELKRIQRQLGISFLVVTHDQEEAMALADKIAIMQAGKIIQIGTPWDVYNNPKTRYVAEFLGSINCFKMEKVESVNKTSSSKKRISKDSLKVKLTNLDISFDLNTKTNIINKTNTSSSDNVYCVRPEKLSLSRELVRGQAGTLVRITRINYLGNYTKYFCELLGKDLVRQNKEIEVVLAEEQPAQTLSNKKSVSDDKTKPQTHLWQPSEELYLIFPSTDAIVFIDEV